MYELLIFKMSLFFESFTCLFKSVNVLTTVLSQLSLQSMSVEFSAYAEVMNIKNKTKISSAINVFFINFTIKPSIIYFAQIYLIYNI